MQWVKPKKIDYSPRVGKLSKSMKVKKMLKDERLKVSKQTETLLGTILCLKLTAG